MQQPDLVHGFLELGGVLSRERSNPLLVFFFDDDVGNGDQAELQVLVHHDFRTVLFCF
ncbi:MAG: hypothetical protein JW891_04265 [Candidatus Lokiarchaeota archaeon]|nr:hypothetical protein [Candidatus Lokiarchaeota archaeon]